MLYYVQIPLAGHVSLEVEADTEEDAIDKAMDMDPHEGEVTWETLREFHCGNVCYCPRPWEATAEAIDDE